MTLMMTVFIISLVGLLALFGLKYAELRAGRTFAPSMRERLDVRALQLKELIIALRLDLVQVLPFFWKLLRFLIHELALGFAALARILEAQAHRLADLVSHKHRFERRETRSEFLKKVSEHKNGNGSSELNSNN
jgi:hypothetical protein